MLHILPEEKKMTKLSHL